MNILIQQKSVKKKQQNITQESKKRNGSKKKKISLTKRYHLLMNCVAPHLLPQKEITYPLNSITRGDYLTLPEKLIYAELYSMFKMTDKFQYHPSELSRVISLHKNVANIIGRTVHKLNHLKLITIDNVYDKDRKRKTPIGFVLHNNGALNRSVSYDLINKEAKVNHKRKSIHHLQGGLVQQEAQKIIIYMNKITHRSFRPTTKSYIKIISAKLRQKYTINDCKLVIIFKYEDWKNNPKMKQYIQPSTLFAASNFDRYLTNAKVWQKDNPRLFNSDGVYINVDNTRNTETDNENSGGGFHYEDDF